MAVPSPIGEYKQCPQLHFHEKYVDTQIKYSPPFFIFCLLTSTFCLMNIEVPYSLRPFWIYVTLHNQ